MVAITAFLWRTTPGSLVPDEDQGFYISAVILPDGATLERTTRVVEQVEAAVRSNPDNQDVVAFAGFDFIGGGFRNNAATLFVTQKPWHERQTTSQQLVGELFMKTGGHQGSAGTGLQSAGDLRSRHRRRLRVLHPEPRRRRFQTPAGSAAAIPRARQQRPAARRRADLVARERAAALRGRRPREGEEGWRAIDEVFAALSSTLGTYYVNDFNKYGRTWQVLMSAEPEYRKRPDDIEGLYVRSQKGEMVPLSALVNVRHASGPDSLDRFNNLPAVKVIGQTAPGISSGQGIARVEQIAKEVLPPDFSFDWGGSSYQEKKSSGASTFALGLAVVMVFLILAAQYEKWSLPLSVLLALPFGTFGALVAIWAKNLIGPFFHATPLTNDVYFQIGLVTLLGLAAKNAILIVEFAVLKHAEGLSASASAIEAARLRFRPILMTSLAFILGVLPLAISTGAGAGARHSVGTGVMGGMIAATLLAVFHVPLFFKVLYDRRIRETRSHDELLDEVRHLHHVIRRSGDRRRRSTGSRKEANMTDPRRTLRSLALVGATTFALAACQTTPTTPPLLDLPPATATVRQISSAGGRPSTTRR
jgi:multidrug efflux pump